MEDQALRIIVHGRVQGVGFRYFVLQHARHLGLRGFARNRADGSVEVVVIGSATAVDRLQERVRQGPPGARVDSVDSAPLEPGFSCESFQIKG